MSWLYDVDQAFSAVISRSVIIWTPLITIIITVLLKKIYFGSSNTAKIWKAWKVLVRVHDTLFI